jgi:hypothetical protein
MDFTFFYIIIAVGVGWMIGFFDSNLRTSKKIRIIEETAERLIEEAKQKNVQLEKKSTDAATTQDNPGLLRLKKVNGRYLLDLDGAPVTAEMSLDMRKRLVELLSVFRLWLDPAQPLTSASQPATHGKAQRPAEPDPIREAVYGSPQPDFVEEVQEASPVVAAAEAVSRPAPAKKSEVEKNIASLSIVQQIDTVLQERLLSSPLALRGIRLQESIQGGVEVYVGSQKFHSVDDVPDAEIKAAIRSAITAWEKKYTPGV